MVSNHADSLGLICLGFEMLVSDFLPVPQDKNLLRNYNFWQRIVTITVCFIEWSERDTEDVAVKVTDWYFIYLIFTFLQRLRWENQYCSTGSGINLLILLLASEWIQMLNYYFNVFSLLYFFALITANDIPFTCIVLKWNLGKNLSEWWVSENIYFFFFILGEQTLYGNTVRFDWSIGHETSCYPHRLFD